MALALLVVLCGLSRPASALNSQARLQAKFRLGVEAETGLKMTARGLDTDTCTQLEDAWCYAKTLSRHGYISTVIAKSARTVWDVVGNFNKYADWSTATSSEASIAASSTSPVTRLPTVNEVTVTEELINYDPSRFTILYKVTGSTVINTDKNEFRFTVRAITNPQDGQAATMVEWEGFWEVITATDADYSVGLVHSLFHSERQKLIDLLAV